MRADAALRRLVAFTALLATWPGAALAANVNGSYFAVIVSDVDASAAWYRSVLGLQTVSRLSKDGEYDIVNLHGPGIFVELLELPAALGRPAGDIQGPFKVGMLVDDLPAFVAGLPDSEPEPKQFQDDELGLSAIQLVDPDGNIVQVMMTLESAPD